jgi:hypothetical protein
MQSIPMAREEDLETRHTSHVTRHTSHLTLITLNTYSPKPTTDALAQNIAPIETSSCRMIEMIKYHDLSFNVVSTSLAEKRMRFPKLDLKAKHASHLR